jgi:hypothetical protein
MDDLTYEEYQAGRAEEYAETVAMADADHASILADLGPEPDEIELELYSEGLADYGVQIALVYHHGEHVVELSDGETTLRYPVTDSLAKAFVLPLLSRVERSWELSGMDDRGRHAWRVGVVRKELRYSGALEQPADPDPVEERF